MISFNHTLAKEIPGGWDNLILGMPFEKAKKTLQIKCKSIDKMFSQRGYDCGHWNGNKIDVIHLSDKGLPFFKKLNIISLSFRHRNDFIYFHNILSSKWEISEKPYCWSIDFKVPYKSANFDEVIGCMAWYSNNLIQLDYMPNEERLGIGIEYRNPN